MKKNGELSYLCTHKPGTREDTRAKWRRRASRYTKMVWYVNYIPASTPFSLASLFSSLVFLSSLFFFLFCCLYTSSLTFLMYKSEREKNSRTPSPRSQISPSITYIPISKVVVSLLSSFLQLNHRYICCTSIYVRLIYICRL